MYAHHFWNEAKTQLGEATRMRGDHSDGDPDWDSRFKILSDTLCPAVLTENLFMDNHEDCLFLLSEEGKATHTDIHVNAIQRIIHDFK